MDRQCPDVKAVALPSPDLSPEYSSNSAINAVGAIVDVKQVQREQAPAQPHQQQQRKQQPPQRRRNDLGCADVTGSPGWALILYGVLAITDHILWVSFWPIAEISGHFFSVGPTAIFMLSMLYVIVFVLFAPFAGQAVDRRGLRYGVLMGSFLNFLGTLIKVIPAPFSLGGITGYVFTFVGHLVGGVAHSFILILPTTLAQNWFSPASRVTAQAFCAIFNQMGVIIGIFLTPVISNSEERIALLLLLQCIGSLLVYVTELMFFVGEPIIPVSLSTTRYRYPYRIRSTVQSICFNFGFTFSLASLKDTIVNLLQVPGYALSILSFGIAVGAHNALFVILSVQTLMTRGQFMNANLLLVYTFIGIIGALAIGQSIDRSLLNHKPSALASYIGFVVSLFLFSVGMLAESDNIVAVSCAFMGLFSSALTPSTFDLLMEITYPAPQAVVTALAFVVGQLWSVMFIWGNSGLEHLQYYAPSLFLTSAGVVGVCVFAGAENSQYLRKEYESEAKRRLQDQIQDHFEDNPSGRGNENLVDLEPSIESIEPLRIAEDRQSAMQTAVDL